MDTGYVKKHLLAKQFCYYKIFVADIPAYRVDTSFIFSFLP